MDFNFQRHFRLAGVIVIFVGFFLNNLPVMLLGNVIVAIGYMASIGKIEAYIEKQTESKEDDDVI